jgi:hypothetical protein
MSLKIDEPAVAMRVSTWFTNVTPPGSYRYRRLWECFDLILAAGKKPPLEQYPWFVSQLENDGFVYEVAIPIRGAVRGTVVKDLHAAAVAFRPLDEWVVYATFVGGMCVWMRFKSLIDATRFRLSV